MAHDTLLPMGRSMGGNYEVRMCKTGKPLDGRTFVPFCHGFRNPGTADETVPLRTSSLMEPARDMRARAHHEVIRKMVEGRSFPYRLEFATVLFPRRAASCNKFWSSLLLRLLFHRKLPVKKISWTSALIVGVAFLLTALVKFTLDPSERTDCVLQSNIESKIT